MIQIIYKKADRGGNVPACGQPCRRAAVGVHPDYKGCKITI